MTNTSSLLKLLSWLSPAFPTGAFSYSSGLEAAIDEGLISDRDSLANWLTDNLRNGPARNDAIFLGLAWDSSEKINEIAELCDLALALCSSHERYLETTAQGNAFIIAASEWNQALCETLPTPITLPIAIGALGKAERIGKTETQVAYLHAFISNQIQAALRLMKLGQQNGLHILKQLEPVILGLVDEISSAQIDDLGSATIIADIAAMRHETMPVRIFRT